MTSTKTDEEIVALVAERLEKGFDGMKQMFRTKDPNGGETITQTDLQKILYNVLGYIHTDQYQRFLQNVGLAHKDYISFDVFVSRFKDSEVIKKAWTNPVKREFIADIESRAHAEEDLRDCEVFEWGQLKTGPHANYLLLKALKERKVDFRALLPEQCFMPDGVVDRVQMRHALSELGVYLSDVEYGDFWDWYDTKKRGVIPTRKLYNMLRLREDGEPLTPPPQAAAPRTPMTPPYRDPAKSYNKYYHKLHTSPRQMAKPQYDPRLTEGICGTPLGRSRGPQATPKSEIGEDTEREIEEEAQLHREDTTVAAEARAKIRGVMSKTSSPGKFDCAFDSLSYKFEQRYKNMLQAFKLFDISEDGYVMRIDFRRVLAEFGFPLTAIQLGNFINCIGQIITHGQINYRMMMTKLMTRTDGFVSRVLDSKIMAQQEGGTEQALGEDDNVVEVACRLVEYLHHDYIKMAATLLKLDKNDKAVIHPPELRRVIENTIGDKLSPKAWEELEEKCLKDDHGDIRYIEFMQTFDAEPGSWNLVTHGQVTVPKQPVAFPMCQEALNLEKAKAEINDGLKTEKQEGERRPDVLREDLRKFFADHLFDFDHQYHMLDRKASNNFSRWQFGALLKQCGFHITEKELEKVWMTLRLSDNNMSSYNSVVMEFAPGHESFHLPNRKPGDDEEEGGQGGGDGGEEEKTAETSQKPPTPASSGFGDRRTGQMPVDGHTYVQNIMKKLQPAVTAHWERLKQGFKNLDPHGFGSVTYKQMQLLIDSCKSGLTQDERNQMCSQFDFRNSGRCNYLAFMKTFAQPPPPVSKFVYAPHTHKLEKQRHPKRTRLPISSMNKLIKHHKNLRRAFQKKDKARTGYISVADFKSIFRECNLPVSDEDYYHILTEFDEQMNGKIRYEEFFNTLLRM